MKAVFSISLVALAILGAAGCGNSGRTRPPSTHVTVVDAAPHLPALDFLRVERPEATLEFRQAQTLTFDEDEYTFHLATTSPDTGASVEIASFDEQLSAESDYVFVITEAAGVPEFLVLDSPPFDPTSTDSQFAVVHASDELPDMDFYLEPPGTDLSTVSPRGTLSFRTQLPPVTSPAGDYVVTLTEPGNSANVMFTSATITLVAGQPGTFVVTASGGEGSADFYVLLVGQAVATLYDVNQTGLVRALNAAADRMPRDIYFGDDLMAPPLFSSLAFGALTDLLPVTIADTSISVTPVGNPSTVEASNQVTLGATRIFFTLVGGTAGALNAPTFADDLRPLQDVANLRFFNGVNEYDTIQIFVENPGTDISTELPSEVLAALTAGTRKVISPGTYELTIRDAATATVIAGPEPISLVDGGVYSIIFIDNADASTADMLVIDDSNR